MIHAYDEIYLDDAMKNLGEAVDYAVNSCNIGMGKFFELFIGTGLARQFENGVPKFVAGLSGTELVHEVAGKAGIELPLPSPQLEIEYSASYWHGWIIAYYQWYTGRSLKEIFANVSEAELERLYPTLHEASEEKAVDVINKMIERKNSTAKLQILRQNCGYSQRELAIKSGVNLRTLQQYELKAKDINKAASGTLLALSKVLGCEMEALMEP